MRIAGGMRVLLCGMMAAGILWAGGVLAAEKKPADPPLPKPLQTMADQGAQLRYMGREYGMDAWVAIQRGREQFFYVTGAGDAMIMGLLFDTETGRMVTMDQVQKVQQESGGVLDLFAARRPEAAADDAAPSSVLEAGNNARAQIEANVAGGNITGASVAGVAGAGAIQTPAEKMMADIESANYITLGQAGAPVVYAFIDPQCPYCHAFVQDLRANYLQNGLVQLRLIPVGFRDETRAQAAFLLGAPDAADRFMRHLDGDKDALPVANDINQQGVQRNMAVMQAWKLDVTPLIVYRARTGDVKIIQGRAKSIQNLIADLPPRS